MNKKSKKGFTIIELLAAIVVVGIIASLAAVVINKYILQGRNAVDSQLEKQLVLAAKSYYSDNKTKFITNEDTGVVVWYTTLKAESYMTNDLVDSDGNSCAKSYVVVKKDNTKYSYDGCVLCDNGGYNTANGKEECTESLRNNIYCEWRDSNNKVLTSNDKTYLGVKKNNEVTFKLFCKGRGINFKTGSSLNNTNVNSMISTKLGKVTVSNYDSSVNSKNEITSFVSDIKYTTLSNVDGNGSISLDENSAYIIDNLKQKVGNEAAIYDGIVIDGKGPSCTLSGPYKDSGLKTSVKAVKSGTTVYYGLNCKDDNNVNGSIETSGFATSDSISELNIVSKPKNDAKEKSAVIGVKVTKGSTSKLKLTYKKDQLHDDYDNTNTEVSSSINGSSSTLVIDDMPPTCTFNGPSDNALFQVTKKFFDVTNGKTEFAFYELRCTDENGIDPSTFRFSDIKNNGFGKIEQSGDMLAIKNNENITIGYRYLIKVYKVSSLSGDPYDAYLTYSRSNLKDAVGNNGVGTDKSKTIKMIDGKQIPSCTITSSDRNGYKLLTGTITSKYKITGYKWNYDSPSYEGYTNSSSTTTTYNAYNSGTYYLSVVDEYGLEGYCPSEYIYILAPDTPVLTANYDYLSSGSWHKNSFRLSASSNDSNVTYYYGNSSYNVTSTYGPSISSETSGDWYYAKACWNNNPQVCSSNAQYLAKLDMTPPTCSVSMTKSGSCAASGGNYTGGWTQCNVSVDVYNCYDSLSGISGSSSYSTTYTSEGEYNVSAGSISDKAGNTFTSSNSVVKIDRTDPIANLSCNGSYCTFNCSDSNGISCINYAIGEQYSGVTTGQSCRPGDYTNEGRTSIGFYIPSSYKYDKVTVVGECTDYARNGSSKSIYNYDAYPSTVTCALSITNPSGQQIYSKSSKPLTISGNCRSDNGIMSSTYLSGGGVIQGYYNGDSYAGGSVDNGFNRTITITLRGCDNKGSCGYDSRTITQTK